MGSLPIPCGCSCCSYLHQLPCTTNCCKCPSTGNLTFDIFDCQAYIYGEDDDGMEIWVPVDSCCTGMSFPLSHDLGYTICSMTGHVPGGLDEGGTGCLTTGEAPLPTGTGIDVFPELWGFTGTVCGDCTTIDARTSPEDPLSGWENPHFSTDECGGMCVRASLCCCPAPNSGNGRCGAGGAAGTRNPKCECASPCYKFTMAPFECHDIDSGVICPGASGTFKSVCSPCSFLEMPTVTGVFGGPPPDPEITGCMWDCDAYANATGSTMGSWDVWASCEPQVATSRQCGVRPYTGTGGCSGQCPGSGSSSKKFMLLVDGVYQSQCDCATGEFRTMCDPSTSPYGPTGVGLMMPVYVKFSGLISDS